MIYTLTFAPAIDLYVETNDFSIGGINHPFNEDFIAGGKGINVSRMLKILGRDSICLGFVGGFTGEYIKYYLKQRGVKMDFIETNVPCRVNIKVTGAIKETAFNMQAPTFTNEEIAKLFKKFDLLKKGDFLVVCGATNSNISNLKEIDYLLDKLSKKGVILVADMTKTSLLRILKHHPFLIKPNKEELEEIFFTHLNSKEDIIKYAKKLIKSGAKNVLVSLGANGAILVNKKDVFTTDAPDGKVINTVSSGDSMVAGFLDEFIKTKDYKKALIKSAIVGSATAFAKNMATFEQIQRVEEKFLKKLANNKHN